MDQASEWFVQHLIDTLGEYSSLVGIETAHPDWGLVLGIVYQHFPEPGLTTGFTYGLSAALHPEWQTTRPELCLTVESLDADWIVALVQLVEWHRANHPFTPGSLFHFGKALSPDSLMDSLLIFDERGLGLEAPPPPVGPSQLFEPLPSPSGPLQLYRALPLYHDEVGLIKKVGIRKFTGLPEFQWFSGQRDDLSKIYHVGG